MKFLLAAIHAKYIHTGLAVYSLRSYAGKEMREHVEVAEYTINQRMEQILADIYRRSPDVIGFSCYIWNFSMIKKLVRELAKLLPGVPVWLGGPEVSYEYEKILAEYPEVSGIMTGEGEETFRELLQAYLDAERGVPANAEATGGIKETRTQDGQKTDAQRETENTRAEKEFRKRQKNLRGQPVSGIRGTATREGFFGAREPLDMDRLPFY